jgi:predicted transcriptional regulator
MLKSLITSEIRIKLLLKFFLNPKTDAYLRQLSTEFDESTNGIRVELNRLVEANILNTETKGRNKLYKANESHPLFEEIRKIVLKSTGIEKVISNIISKLGKVDIAFIRGDYAVGHDSGLIELVVVGDKINKSELERVRRKTEKLIERKISIIILDKKEFKNLKTKFLSEPNLVLMKEGK